jgi:hypothetical protein
MTVYDVEQGTENEEEKFKIPSAGSRGIPHIQRARCVGNPAEAHGAPSASLRAGSPRW